MVFAHACFPSIDLRSPSSSHHPMDVFPDNEASDRTLRVKTYTKFEADATRVTRCLPGKIAPNSGNLSRARATGNLGICHIDATGAQERPGWRMVDLLPSCIW